MENASQWSGMHTGLVHGDGAHHCLQTSGFPSQVYRVGIYGWRKRCLYMFVLLLMVMVIINMALLIWIIKVMDFSINGMGKLRILQDGIRVDGQAEFMSSLYAKTVESRKDVPLKIESAQNLTLNARNQEGQIVNRLFIGDRKIESMAGRFLIKNSKGEVLFSADDKEIQAAAESLKIVGFGGVAFDESVQTLLVNSKPGSPLRLESPTHYIQMEAPRGISLQSEAGDINAVCLSGLTIQSTSGSIILDSNNIIFKQLPEATNTTSSPSQIPDPAVTVFQLCVCENGRLFRAPPNGPCRGNVDICK